MEIIEIKTHNDLPANTELILYEPPYYDADPMHEIAVEFKKKYGSEPQTIYQKDHQLFVVKP